MRIGIANAVLLAAMAAACVPSQAPPARVPAPAPAPQPSPSPAAARPPAEIAPVDWTLAPLSAGDWRFSLHEGRPHAQFTAEDGVGSLALSCEAGGRVALSFAPASGATLLIRTSYGERRLPVRPGAALATATIGADDPLLDEIAFSRGRVMIETDGAGRLIVPAWPEIARVTEDCRGQ